MAATMEKFHLLKFVVSTTLYNSPYNSCVGISFDEIFNLTKL
jgi:hypothetical protein